MRRVKILALSVMLVAALFVAATANGGSSSDPLVSKSYVDVTFFKQIVSEIGDRADKAMADLKSKYFGRIADEAVVSYSDDALVTAVADEVLEQLQAEGKYLYSTSAAAPKTLISGDIISAKSGTIIILTSGSANCKSGSLIDITKGKEQYPGSALGGNTSYMFPENGGKVEITSKTATVLIDGRYSLTGYDVKYMDEAYALKKLGLVRGAADGMELYRGNTRAESITMLIRLLGEEESALSVKHQHPFTDVDAWAQNYVGYAYRMGYTKGVSETLYHGSTMTTNIQYMTFILRALGYSEEAGDFDYASAIDDAVRLGVISQNTASELYSSEFRRDQAMHISYLAMSAKVKGSNRTLLSKLVANGVVDGDAANEFLNR